LKDYASSNAQNPSETKKRILEGLNPSGKNPGDCWSINPKPFSEAHFAVFPPELVRRCLKATAPRQVCCKCGKPRERITKVKQGKRENKRNKTVKAGMPQVPEKGWRSKRKTVGWSDCGCGAGFESGLVLDPFVGSGTTLQVCQELGVNGIGVELNSEYASMILRRLNCKSRRKRNVFVNLRDRVEFVSEKDICYKRRKKRVRDESQSTLGER
jgi:hypothetical protein